ncbi:MAG: hypothetical protein QM776_13575 [Rhodocyclaceae bacterium]
MRSATGYKPSVTVVLSCAAGDTVAVLSERRCSRLPVYDKPEDLVALVDKQLAESGLFSTYRFAPSNQSSDYTLDIRLVGHYPSLAFRPASMVATFVNRVSLGLIPVFETDNYQLEVKLLDRSRQAVATVANKDSTTSWSGIWVLPFSSYPPSASESRAFEETIRNQLQAALNELARRNALTKPRA